MRRAGRELEELVALLEEALGPSGAKVASPDHIADRETGETREVDVSIRAVVGSVPVLVIIECRDRSRIQDVTWIEQVAQKRNGLGAAKAVAVASSGFSGAAMAKAQALGIETRVIRQITMNEVRAWLQIQEVSFIDRYQEMRGVEVELDTRQIESALDLASSVNEALRGKTSAECVFIAKRSGIPCSVDTLWNFLWGTEPLMTRLFRGVPGDGTRVKKRLKAVFANPQDCYQMLTKEGLVDVKSVTFVLHCWAQSSLLTAERMVSYGNAEGAIADLVRYKGSVNDKGCRMSFIRAPGGRTSLTVEVTRQPEGGPGPACAPDE